MASSEYSYETVHTDYSRWQLLPVWCGLFFSHRHGCFHLQEEVSARALSYVPVLICELPTGHLDSIISMIKYGYTLDMGLVRLMPT